MKINDTDHFNHFLAAMRAKERNITVVPVAGDGACLFRAVSVHLHGNENHHLQIRQEVVDFMRDNNALFEELVREDMQEFGGFNEYLNHLEKPASWAGNSELHAVSLLHNRRIHIHDLNNLGESFL